MASCLPVVPKITKSPVQKKKKIMYVMYQFHRIIIFLFWKWWNLIYGLILESIFRIIWPAVCLHPPSSCSGSMATIKVNKIERSTIHKWLLHVTVKNHPKFQGKLVWMGISYLKPHMTIITSKKIFFVI